MFRVTSRRLLWLSVAPIVIVAGLTSWSAMALGSQWIPLVTTRSGSVWSVEKTTMGHPYKSSVSVWVKIDHSRDKTETAHESEGMLVLWCGSRQFEWQSLSAFDAAGRPVNRWSPASMADNVPPDTAVETVYDWTCDRSNTN
jgi:hypothetical protein